MSIYITTVIDGPAAVVMGKLEIDEKNIVVRYQKRVNYPDDTKLAEAEYLVRKVLETLEQDHKEVK